ncbi:hypothetical protein [Micromonospora sp. DH14]|uniref:hypothetical protein n=1 Tax=Micromonospora sp. DH14 TaxID=3040120 RepID=UPI00244276E8|nr:hypothetical protein [Micromonospora sp. DH14]MDG9674819.1 hypothetical protein [Micromonospora sp. DH14]
MLAQWMRSSVGPLPMERSAYGSGFGLLDDDRAYASIGESVRVSRNSLLHQVTRAVCAVCNNGWMSRLEAAAKPILMNLFDARRTNTSTMLSTDEATVLARWAVKTSWTSELSGLGDQNQEHAWMPADMRRRLCLEEVPPVTSWVWLAACEDLDLCQQFQAHVTYDRTTPPTLGETPRRILASCLILNGIALLVHSFDSRVPFPPPLTAPHGLRLWPSPSPVEFPPPSVSQMDLFLAVGRYTHWLPLHDRPFDPSATCTIGPGFQEQPHPPER